MFSICLNCKKRFLLKRNTKGKFCFFNCYWESLQGKPPWNKGTRGVMKSNTTSFREKDIRLVGKNNPLWKGDDVGIVALHTWVRRKKGIPKVCKECGTTKAKRYEWANISMKYKRAVNDYRSLCVSCHRKEGFKRGEYIPWNKGKMSL